MESNPITVTWKYTIVGPKITKHWWNYFKYYLKMAQDRFSWPLPSLRGGRILSYIFGSAGKISANIRPFLIFLNEIHQVTSTCSYCSHFLLQYYSHKTHSAQIKRSIEHTTIICENEGNMSLLSDLIPILFLVVHSLAFDKALKTWASDKTVKRPTTFNAECSI